jgi:hypothetical protein
MAVRRLEKLGQFEEKQTHYLVFVRNFDAKVFYTLGTSKRVPQLAPFHY